MTLSDAGSRATIFDLQRFSIHDGPGIRTVVFFKGCSLRCPWCHNPEGVRVAPEVTWSASRCSACLTCLTVCPRRAVRVDADARIDWNLCDHCGECVKVCPSLALRHVGQAVSVDDLVQRCLADRDFYATSGGGVTLSGGEPVLQAGAAARLLRGLRSAGVHTLLETAGSYPFEMLEPLLPHLDQIYFDWKVPLPEQYRVHTGGDGHRIASNLARLLALGAPVRVRIPLVPGINDSADQAAAAARTLHQLGIRDVILLRYNHLWEAKLPTLSAPPPPLGVRARDDVSSIVAAFAAAGMEARPAWVGAEGN